ncbi:hypothetical protein [Simplicispira lacusdiani]|uniref:hypothetical protein n=1 Tax=Simplicispira lacusdiani TaxID=2213010 RepID=UPI001E2DD460|nr:hypothetical protein [Simplicispira lacusdiani]
MGLAESTPRTFRAQAFGTYFIETIIPQPGTNHFSPVNDRLGAALQSKDMIKSFAQAPAQAARP